MLVAFPEDLMTSAHVAKAMSGFGIMVDWHEMEILARVVVKVYLNNEALIPDSVKVNVGLPQRGRSWIVLIFVLKKKAVLEVIEEAPYVTTGPLYPLPMWPSRWNGPVPPAPSEATLEGSNAELGGNQNAAQR